MFILEGRTEQPERTILLLIFNSRKNINKKAGKILTSLFVSIGKIIFGFYEIQEKEKNVFVFILWRIVFYTKRSKL